MKGGIGSTSAEIEGLRVGALVAVNPAGSVVVGGWTLFLGGTVRAQCRVRRARLPGSRSG